MDNNRRIKSLTGMLLSFFELCGGGGGHDEEVSHDEKEATGRQSRDTKLDEAVSSRLSWSWLMIGWPRLSTSSLLQIRGNENIEQ